jgi:hypothetical protein
MRTFVARVWNRGIYIGRVAYIKGYSNGYVEVVVRTMTDYETVTLPYACIEIDSD